MLNRPLNALFRVLGPRYPRAVLAVQFALGHIIVLGGVGLLSIYQPMTAQEFWTILIVGECLMAIENVAALTILFKLVAPAVRWLRGARSEEETIAAWRALTSLPRDFFAYRRAWAVVVNLVPISVFITVYLSLPWYSVFVLMMGAAVVLLYGAVARFFGMELTMRPVLRRISEELPDGIDLGRPAVPLRWKILAGLPAINIITGVVVAGLSTTGQASLSDLGVDVVVAVLVAFTLSLELTVLVSRSVVEPVRDLRKATERVREGDLGVRVPVVSTDETGVLASSFNAMVAGLEEREKLRDAFGSYVDPELADRILEEGHVLEGEEVEVSVLFLDIRGFTAFAEQTEAHEVVRRLNAFYEGVVPVLVKHGGHANKFIGDGLLGVFGAPDHLADHADRAVAAALEIARLDHKGLRIGIGINSGTVLAGTIGGGGRLEFTVIGDAVNTAARVEDMTRETGDDVLVTEATRSRLRSARCGFEPRGTVELKGKREPVALFACLRPGVSTPPSTRPKTSGRDRAAPPRGAEEQLSRSEASAPR